MPVDKVEKVMHEFKHGELHSGSKEGPEVTGRQQAIAIGLSEARKAGQKVSPKRASKRSSKRWKMAEKWMQKAFGAHPGALHRALGVPEGEKIPAKKMAQAKGSSDPHMKKMASLARTGKKYAGKRWLMAKEEDMMMGDGHPALEKHPADKEADLAHGQPEGSPTDKRQDKHLAAQLHKAGKRHLSKHSAKR
jgi:hypothetical protein